MRSDLDVEPQGLTQQTVEQFYASLELINRLLAGVYGNLSANRNWVEQDHQI
jgi:hypothetical protein